MWTATITVEDRKGKQSSFSFNFSPSRTLAQIEAWLNAIATPIAGIILGAVRAISITRQMVLGIAWQPIAEDNADVEEKAFVNMRSQAGYPTKTTIPTLNEGMVVVGTSTLDPANPNVIGLVTAIEDGVDVAGTIVKPSDNRGSDVVEVVSLTEVFTGSKGS